MACGTFLLEALGDERVAVAIPVQDAHRVPSAREEDVHRAAQRVLGVLRAHEQRQAVDPLAAVDSRGGDEHARPAATSAQVRRDRAMAISASRSASRSSRTRTTTSPAEISTWRCADGGNDTATNAGPPSPPSRFFQYAQTLRRVSATA